MQLILRLAHPFLDFSEFFADGGHQRRAAVVRDGKKTQVFELHLLVQGQPAQTHTIRTYWAIPAATGKVQAAHMGAFGPAMIFNMGSRSSA